MSEPQQHDPSPTADDFARAAAARPVRNPGIADKASRMAAASAEPDVEYGPGRYVPIAVLLAQAMFFVINLIFPRRPKPVEPKTWDAKKKDGENLAALHHLSDPPDRA